MGRYITEPGLREQLDNDDFKKLFVYSHASIATERIKSRTSKRISQQSHDAVKLKTLTVPNNIYIVDVTLPQCYMEVLKSNLDKHFIDCIRKHGLSNFLLNPKWDTPKKCDFIKLGGTLSPLQEYWQWAKLYEPGDTYFDLNLFFALQDIQLPDYLGGDEHAESDGKWGIYDFRGLPPKTHYDLQHKQLQFIQGDVNRDRKNYTDLKGRDLPDIKTYPLRVRQRQRQRQRTVKSRGPKSRAVKKAQKSKAAQSEYDNLGIVRGGSLKQHGGAMGNIPLKKFLKWSKKDNKYVLFLISCRGVDSINSELCLQRNEHYKKEIQKDIKKIINIGYNNLGTEAHHLQVDGGPREQREYKETHCSSINSPVSPGGIAATRDPFYTVEEGEEKDIQDEQPVFSPMSPDRKVKRTRKKRKSIKNKKKKRKTIKLKRRRRKKRKN
jgi:hypothetical protein